MSTPSHSQRSEHVANMLPGFVNQTLPRQERDAVLEHIQRCMACTLELRAWEVISDATRLAASQPPGATVSVFDALVARIDAETFETAVRDGHDPAPVGLPRVFSMSVRTPSRPEEAVTLLAAPPAPLSPVPEMTARGTRRFRQLNVTRWPYLVAAALLVLTTMMGLTRLGPQDRPGLRSDLLWQPAEQANVPMDRGNPARTGEMPGPGPALEPAWLWCIMTGGQVSASPALVNGVLYVGSADDSVYAWEAGTGDERWAFNTGANDALPPTVADGLVYVGGANTGPDDGFTNLLVLDVETGILQWRVPDAQADSPLVVNGVLYVGNRDGFLLALDATDGTERWRTETGRVMRGVTMDEGVIFAPNQDGLIVAIDAGTGKERWRYQTEGGDLGTIAAGGGMIYGVTVDGREDQLYALDAANGEERWRFAIGSPLQPVAVSDGVVYVPSGDGNLYALDARQGDELWRFALDTSAVLAPVVADGTVYVSGTDWTLYAVDASTGQEQWHVDDGGPIGTSAVVSGGMIYIGVQTGMCALGDGSEAPAVILPAGDAIATPGSP